MLRRLYHDQPESFAFTPQPVGSVAHIQICGTTSCMICGAEDLVAVCREKIADKPFELSADGKFSWEEVECLGSCTNAPMAQIGKDYYEDLTAESFARLLDEMAAGKVPVPGPQNGRYGAEPLSGLTTLTEHESGKTQYNASVSLATGLGDTLKRIDGTEVPLRAPWQDRTDKGTDKGDGTAKAAAQPEPAATPAAKAAADSAPASAPEAAPQKPTTLSAPREAGADDLKQLKGVGPKLEQTLNDLGFWHFDQIANWGPAEIAWVDENLRFKGRIERDGWVEQARILAKGGETAFSTKVKKGDVY